jgi:hypothetical protein
MSPDRNTRFAISRPIVVTSMTDGSSRCGVWSDSGRKSAGRLDPKTCPATWLFSSAAQPRSSTGPIGASCWTCEFSVGPCWRSADRGMHFDEKIGKPLSLDAGSCPASTTVVVLRCRGRRLAANAVRKRAHGIELRLTASMVGHPPIEDRSSRVSARRC